MKTQVKKLLSWIITTAMLMSILPTFAFADEVCEIATAAELVLFRDRVNAGEYTLDAVLTADIDLSAEEWTAIGGGDGYATTYYGGSFDGQGHTVSNMTVNADYNHAGLFGYVKGTIANVLVVNANVTSSKNNVGGIAGTIIDGKIENCMFSGNVTNTKSTGGYAGGIAGYIGNTRNTTPTVQNCVNTGTVIAPYAGGITGYAKFANPIANCYNTGAIEGKTHTGGIAGQIMNGTVIENCYNTGAVTGKNASGIVGFNGTRITNSYWTQPDNCYTGGTGTLEDCEKIASPEGLLDKLGSAFVADEADINGGYPILPWQSGGAVIEKDPHITITGASTLEMTNNSQPVQTTLTVSFTDMEAEEEVDWSCDSDIITLTPPDTENKNNKSVIATANKAGTAVVTAAAGEYTAEFAITVMPFITTAKIDGIAAAGRTVKAQVSVLGGDEYDYENYPKLTFQWRCLTNEDYLAGNTTSYQNIDGAVSREFEIPDSLQGEYLSFTVSYGAKVFYPSSPVRVMTAQEAAEQEKQEEDKKTLQEASGSLGDYYTLHPKFGTDTNVADMVKNDLKKLNENAEIDVSVKSIEEVYGGAGIADNGDITYFYADPNAMPTIRIGSYKVVFILSIDNVSVEKEVPVIICWDRNKVKEVMRSDIVSAVTENTLLAENSSLKSVTENLTLPRVADNKKWTLISWQSSDDSVISVSAENQGTADTLFNPYVGKITRGAEDKQVTLTAVFTFNLTNNDEDAITINKVFDVTVRAIGSEQADEIRAELSAKLDAGFEKAGVKDAATGGALSAEEGKYIALNDIQLPTTRDFGIDGKYYPVTVASDSELVQTPDVSNAARVRVYRPAVGMPDEDAELTVTVTDKNTNVSVSKILQVTVPALTTEEVEAEKALMKRVKDAYFDGIKGENTAANDISTNLTPFFEVYDDNGTLVWVRENASKTNCGIVPAPLDGWEKLEAWRLFKTSNPAAVTHENLLVTQQRYAKAVTVSSVLTSEALGKYGELYASDPVKYEGYANLAELYRQNVQADLVVRGRTTPVGVLPSAVEEKINVSFILEVPDGTAINVKYTDLKEGTTAFDVFDKALKENGFAYENKGSYIASVTTADGKTIAEKSAGKNSGWLYKVNGKLSDFSIGAYGLKTGDTVKVFFTEDYTKEADDKKAPSRSGGTSSRARTTVSQKQLKELNTVFKDILELLKKEVMTYSEEQDHTRAILAATLAGAQFTMLTIKPYK